MGTRTTRLRTENLTMSKFLNSLAAPTTAMALGIAGGFLACGAAAKAIDSWEASQCPEVTRIRVNGGTMFGDWVTWGQCPRDGLVVPLKP